MDEEDRSDNGPIVFFGVAVGVYTIFAFVRAVVFFRTVLRSSQNIHDQMFEAVSQTSVFFFDSNPVGRILNRFSKGKTFELGR